MPSLFRDTLEDELSQGDVYPTGWDGAAETTSLIVVAHGCDIDKTEEGSVLAAEIRLDAATTDATLLENVKAGRVFHALYLHGATQPGWVNLRTLGQVSKDRLVEHRTARIHSMSDAGRDILAGAVTQYLLRQTPVRLRYFRDAERHVWDVWEVRAKDVRSFGDRLKRIPPALANGWLCFTSATTGQVRRLPDYPSSWAFLRESQFRELLTHAAAPDPKSRDEAECTAVEGYVRPPAD